MPEGNEKNERDEATQRWGAGGERTIFFVVKTSPERVTMFERKGRKT